MYDTDRRRKVRWISAVLAAFVLAVLTLSVVPTAAASLAPAGADFAAGPGSAPAAALPSTVSPLQTLVSGATAGATIVLPPGTFIGQLWVGTSISLVGAGIGKTILQSPASMSPDSLGNVFVLEIGHHATVQVSGLTVRVTEQCMLANSIGVATGGGIGVRGNATLQTWDVSVSAFGPAPDLNQPCNSHGSPGMLSFGRAISVGLDDPPGVGTNHEVEGHGWIEHVETRGFDIFSISVGGVRGPSGSTATIKYNAVSVGPGPYTAAYGIVAYGVSVISKNLVTGVPGSDGGIAVVFTSAIVTYNTVENFVCTSAPFPITPPCGVDPLFDDQDLGIFLASITPGTVVAYNTVHDVDSGILVEGPGAPAVVIHNAFTANTYYGFELIDATQTFRSNVVTGGFYGAAVGAASANTTAILVNDSISGYSTALALLEANYPFVAKVVVRAH